MGRLLGSIFGLRPDERNLAFLTATYHFLLLVTLYLLKPVRDSLFLSTRGPVELPYVFILTTAVAAPIALIHTRAGRRLPVGRLIDGVSLFLAASLVGLRGLLSIGGEWVAYPLYAWVSIYGLLITSQFWLLANALFTSSQSKRVFTVLSAGAILGAVVGGEATGILVDWVEVSSENLLWVAAGVLMVATGLGYWIRWVSREKTGVRPDEQDQSLPPSGILATLRSSGHLQLIVSLIAVMVVVTTFVDFQFKTVAARAFPIEEDLTTFMGQFYGRVSILALLVQFVLAPWLLRVVGVGGALSILPGALALGSVGMLLMPGLVAGVLLRGAGQSLKHSVDRTGRELLFVPVSLAMKKRVKVFVDLLIDQGAEGLGGILLLAVVLVFGANVQVLSIVTLALIAVWGVLAYRARHSYVDQFRAQLRRQEPSKAPSPPATEAQDLSLDALVDALCSHVETDVLDAIDRLAAGTHRVPVAAVLPLLDHPAPAVRREALRLFRTRAVEGVAEEVAGMLRDPDPDVQLEAARYLYAQESENRLDRLRQGLTHDDPHIQAAAVGLIAEEGQKDAFELVDEDLLRRLVALEGSEARDTRTHVARILGVLDRPYRNELLYRLLHDDSPRVVRAAIRAAGRTQDRAFVEPLVRALATDPFASDASDALAAFGPPLLGTLYDYLVDDRISLESRRRIPSIFTAHPCHLAVALLIESLRAVPLPVRHASVRALSKLHEAGDLERTSDALDAAVRREAEHYAALGQILRLCRDRDRPAIAPRLQTLREETLERIFRLLGLRYDHRDIYDAYLGITNDDPALRDSAIEFVDNLVDYRTRRYLLPLLDDPELEQAVRVGEQHFSHHLQEWDDARAYMRSTPDPRLTALVEDAGSETRATSAPASSAPS